MPKGSVPLLLTIVTPALLNGTEARAAEFSAAECNEWYGAAKALIDTHLPRVAMDLLRTCEANCAGDFQTFCIKLKREVEQKLPTIVFEVRDSRGQELKGVTVKMCGTVLRASPDGKTYEVDPGTHYFEFETPGKEPLGMPLVVAEGEKGRSQVVVFPSSDAKLPPSRRKRRMVALPAGSFQMGSNHALIYGQRVHNVEMPAFWMDEKEVTAGQYQACVAAGKCTPADTGESCNAGKAERANDPINCVAQPQAEAYCRWEGKRLPTEEEWEYAARGTEGREFPWGPDAPSAARLCWTRSWVRGTCPVGSFKGDRTPQGLYDMAGNVWEWTSSPSGECATEQLDSRCVVRGGCWDIGDPSAFRAAYRTWDDPSNRSDNLGFRCARSR